MSLDRSLKGKGALGRHRNVLKRSERLDILKDEERWDESKSVFGLPKVVVRKAAKKKGPEKKQEEAAAAATEGARLRAGRSKTGWTPFVWHGVNLADILRGSAQPTGGADPFFVCTVRVL